MRMRSSLFWDDTDRRLVVSYRRFGTTYRSHRRGSSSPRRILKYLEKIQMYLEVLREFLWLVGTEKLFQDFLCERKFGKHCFNVWLYLEFFFTPVLFTAH